jgi:hypothetical protein
MAIVANLISVLHAAVAMFVVLGTAAIWMGTFCNWRWTDNLSFRATQFAVIAFVMLRLELGEPCPLSVWEDQVRGSRSNGVAARLAFRGADPRSFRIGCEIMFGVTALLGMRLVWTRRPRPNEATVSAGCKLSRQV